MEVVRVFYGDTLDKVVKHTKPISLSDFIKKVISKVMERKINYLIPLLISSKQSWFVKGRCVIENVLQTQEIVTNIRKRGKPTNVALKLDMTKAYDRVSWLYLAKVLRRM